MICQPTYPLENTGILVSYPGHFVPIKLSPISPFHAFTNKPQFLHRYAKRLPTGKYVYRKEPNDKGGWRPVTVMFA